MPKRIYKRKRLVKRKHPLTKKKLDSKFGLPRMISNVMGKITSLTVSQEFPLLAAFPATAAGTKSTCVYTFSNNAASGTFAAPIVQIAFLSQNAAATSGFPGYSGKLKVAIEQYQFVRVKGFKITFINTVPSGSEAVNSLQPTLDRTPDLAVGVLPADLLSYTGILANLSTDRVIPSDLYEYDNMMKIQPNNTIGKGVSKYYSVPTTPISPRDINSLSAFGSNNSWIYCQNITSALDWQLVLGYESNPVIQNNAAVSFTGSVSVGTICVESLLEFAIPIKNQAN